MTVSMVPRDRGYGQRQQDVAAARDAGLSTKVPQQAPGPPVRAGAQAAPATQRTGNPKQQQQFDGLASREPTGFGRLRPPDTESLVLQQFSQSQSPVLQDIARRIRGF